MLVLKRASKSRPSGQWSDDDYNVFDGERRIGRIMWTHAAPTDCRHWLELMAMYRRAADKLASPLFL
jgi:hypothetical protein